MSEVRAPSTGTGAQLDADPAAPENLANSPSPGAAGEASPPHTGDLVIDSALQDLASTSEEDVDAVLEQGSALEGVLRARLGDLSG